MNTADNTRFMVEFARRWLPYGGGSGSAILETFGLTEHTFYARLSEALYVSDFDLTTEEKCAIEKMCRSKLDVRPSR